MTQHADTRAGDLACTEEVELMTGYLEGELSAADDRRLERHLESCPGCTEYQNQMRTIAGLAEDSIPVDLRAGLIAALPPRPPAVTPLRDAGRSRRDREVGHDGPATACHPGAGGSASPGTDRPGSGRADVQDRGRAASA